MAEEVLKQFEYYYGAEAESFYFIQVPRFLFEDLYFQNMKSDSKILYSLMLDRMSLSRKNGWVDEQGRVYIIYRIETMMENLGCGHTKCAELLRELLKYGMIERKKQGLGKPDIIYVKNFLRVVGEPSNPDKYTDIRKTDLKTSASSDIRKADFQTSEKRISGDTENGSLDIRKTEASNTYVSNNNINKNNMSQKVFSESCLVSLCSEEKGQDGQDLKTDYIELIKDQIDYERLIAECKYEKDTIDGIINVIADIATTTPADGREWINQRSYPHEVVKSRLLKMDYSTILFVLDKLKGNTTKIHKLRSYLLTVLYNAADEMDLSIMNKVNYDMYGGGWEEKGII